MTYVPDPTGCPDDLDVARRHLHLLPPLSDPWEPLLARWAQQWGTDLSTIDPVSLTTEQRRSLNRLFVDLAPTSERRPRPDAAEIGRRIDGLHPDVRAYLQQTWTERWPTLTPLPGYPVGSMSDGLLDWLTAQLDVAEEISEQLRGAP